MTTFRPRRVATLVALAAFPVAALPVAAHAAHARAAKNATVTLKNVKFNPGKVTITRGGSVTWRWADGGTSHNVAGRGIKRSATKSSGSYTVKFSKKGTFRYSCTLHPGMNGTVTVR